MLKILINNFQERGKQCQNTNRRVIRVGLSPYSGSSCPKFKFRIANLMLICTQHGKLSRQWSWWNGLQIDQGNKQRQPKAMSNWKLKYYESSTTDSVARPPLSYALCSLMGSSNGLSDMLSTCTQAHLAPAKLEFDQEPVRGLLLRSEEHTS